MKAQTFKIVGSKTQLLAVQEVLISYGYKFNESQGDSIITNDYAKPETKEQFIELAFLPNMGNSDKVYHLPEQYNEAIDFAKKQLADELWRERLKYGEYGVTSNSRVFKVVADNGGDKLPYTVKFKDGSLSLMGLNVAKATPEEIEEYNRIDWKVGDIAYNKEKNYICKISYVCLNQKETYRADIVNKEGKGIPTPPTDELIKPTPEQIEEFNKPVYKAGDYVYLLNSIKAGAGSAPDGSIAKVVRELHDLSNVSNVIGIEWIETFGKNQQNGGYYPAGFRLATPEEIKKANEPKDGDIVVSIRNKNEIGIVRPNKGYPSTFYSIYSKLGGNIGGSDWKDISNHWRKATKEEIEEFNKPSWNDGDMVFVIDAQSGAGGADKQVGKLTTTLSNNGMLKAETRFDSKYNVQLKNGQIWNVGVKAKLRKATPAEVEEFNKKDYVEMTVGSRNAKIKVYKDKVDIRNGKFTEIKYLKGILDQYSTVNRLGGFEVAVDLSNKFLRIGCTSENNLVSLNEIKAVLDAADKL